MQLDNRVYFKPLKEEIVKNTHERVNEIIDQVHRGKHIEIQFEGDKATRQQKPHGSLCLHDKNSSFTEAELSSKASDDFWDNSSSENVDISRLTTKQLSKK